TDPMSATPTPSGSVMSDSRPARKEPFVWLVVGIPALTVVAGFVTWWIAAQRADSDVADDHYKRGLAINRVLEREEAALQAGLKGHLQVNPDLSLALRLTAIQGAALPEAVQVILTHPVQARQDRRIALILSPDGLYRSAVLNAAEEFKGHWGLAIEGPAWRLSGARLALQPGAVANLGQPRQP
ncbi:MAG: FixH family protein, partial [Burkholderiales bacterium]